MSCKPHVKACPSPFELHRPVPLPHKHTSLAEPSANTYMRKGLPFAIADFLLTQTGTWRAAASECSVVQEIREVQGAHAGLNLTDKALLPTFPSWPWLELLFHAASWEFLLVHKFGSLHFLTGTIIRTIHPNCNTFTVLINEDNTSLTEQLFPTSKITGTP